MMTLRLMQEVVSTVNEQWHSPLADELLLPWEHDTHHPLFWRSSSNFVFFFKKAGQDYVLRFNHADERAAETIQAELDYVTALAAAGIRVAKPVRSRAGNLIESAMTRQGLFHAVVFEALPGKQLDLEEFTPAHLARWGQALGALHQAATRDHKPGRPSWQDHLTMVSEILPAEERATHHELERLRGELEKLPVNAQNFGLIHYDFEPDNLIWAGDQPGIIDFDDCAWYWFVADIALALSDLFADRAGDVNFQNESYLHFLRGYRTVRPIAQDELNLIPLFIRLQNLVVFARLYRALTPVNPQGELPWMAGLRDKLAAKMQFFRSELSL